MWLKSIHTNLHLSFYIIMSLFAILMLFILIQLYYQYRTFKTIKTAKNGVINAKNMSKLVYHRLHYDNDFKKLRYVDCKVFIKKSMFYDDTTNI